MKKLILLPFLFLALTACKGGDSGSSDSTTNACQSETLKDYWFTVINSYEIEADLRDAEIGTERETLLMHGDSSCTATVLVEGSECAGTFTVIDSTTQTGPDNCQVLNGTYEFTVENGVMETCQSGLDCSEWLTQ